MAVQYLPGEEGELSIAMSELQELTPQEKVAFDDVIIHKVEQGFDILTEITHDGLFYSIYWKRRNI